MDALAIGDALAARYRSGTLTPPTPPAGYSGDHWRAIRGSVARLPNAIPQSPWVLVTLPDGEVVLGGGEAVHTMEYHVLFHLAKMTADLNRDTTALLAWLNVLLTATYGQTSLGVTNLKSALPTNYELIVATYAGEEFYGWDITVQVIVREPWTPTP